MESEPQRVRHDHRCHIGQPVDRDERTMSTTSPKDDPMTGDLTPAHADRPLPEARPAAGLTIAADDDRIGMDVTSNTAAVGSLEEDDHWYMHPDDVAEHEARLKFGAPDESGPTNIRRSGAWELARLQAAQHATAHRGRRRLLPRRATQRTRRTRAVRARPSQSSTGDPPPGPRSFGADGVEEPAAAPRLSGPAPSLGERRRLHVERPAGRGDA